MFFFKWSSYSSDLPDGEKLRRFFVSGLIVLGDLPNGEKYGDFFKVV
jgi:hypothetical protein